MFKHGVADGLLEGIRDDNRENNFWYKSGYDYGITLHGRLENLEIPKRAFYVELSIPNTKNTMGFYAYGTSREDAELGFVDPHILFPPEENKEYDFSVEVLSVSETE